MWEPLAGLRFDHVAEKVELHGVFEGGGFGVGADTDLGGSVRADWKPWRHFGLTAGYTFLYVRVSDTVASRTFTAKQTLHGPLLGIGLYF